MKLKNDLAYNINLLKPFNMGGSEINLLLKNCDVDDHGDMLRIIIELQLLNDIMCSAAQEQ